MHSYDEAVVHAQTALLMLKPCLLLSTHEYFNLALSLSLNHRYFPCTVISNGECHSIYINIVIDNQMRIAPSMAR